MMYYDRSKKALPNLPRFLQLVRLVIVVGMILSVIVKISQALGQAGLSTKTTHNLFKIGIALYLISYLAIFGVHMRLWTVRRDLSTIYYKVSLMRNILSSQMIFEKVPAEYLHCDALSRCTNYLLCVRCLQSRGLGTRDDFRQMEIILIHGFTYGIYRRMHLPGFRNHHSCQ